MAAVGVAGACVAAADAAPPGPAVRGAPALTGSLLGASVDGQAPEGTDCGVAVPAAAVGATVGRGVTFGGDDVG
ncbi:MAG TPA: hypothetical protein VIZ43_07020, partial [Trebonia sp.]